MKELVRFGISEEANIGAEDCFLAYVIRASLFLLGGFSRTD